MIPAAAAPHAASASDEAAPAPVAAAVAIPTADRPAFSHTQPAAGDASIIAERDHDLGLLCDRLDTLTRQLGRLVTRMDTGRETAAATETAAADPVGVAIAEIAARQRMLAEAEPEGPTMFPPATSTSVGDLAGHAGDARQASPASPLLDISGLEQHLKLITKQLEILRSPCRAEELAGELRQELTGIARTLDILMPRSTFDALEQEVHALSDRLDASRETSLETGLETSAFAKIEQSVAEIRDAIANLAPVELSEAVRTLAHKVDQISGGGADPLTLQQLDAATNSLRSIVTQVASGDVLTALLNEVRELGEKIDRRLPVASEAAMASPDRELLLALEKEVSGIAATLNAKADQSSAPTLEPLIESIVHRLDRFDLLADDETVLAPIKAQISELGEKIDRFQPAPADPVALAPLETQLGQLAEKIDRLQPAAGDAGALAPLEAQLGQLAETIERMKAPSAEQEALAALNERMQAIALKLDRLEANTPMRADIGPLEQRIAELADKLIASESRLGNLQAIEQGMAELIARLDEIRKAAGVDIQPEAEAAVQAAPPRWAAQDDMPAAEPAKAGDHSAADGEVDHPAAGWWPAAAPPVRPMRAAEAAVFALSADRMEPAKVPPAPIETPVNTQGKPPDAPIEPGSGPPRLRSGRSASERIAVSQAMLGPLPADRTDGAGARPNFIIAARRAAQAASEQQAPAGAGFDNAAVGTAGKALAKRVKSLFLTTSVVMLALVGAGVMLSVSDRLNWGDDRPVELAAPASTMTPLAHRPAGSDTSAPGTATTSHAMTVPPVGGDGAAAYRTIPGVPAAGEGKRHTERVSTVASADTTGSVGLPRATRIEPALPAQPMALDKAASWSDPLPSALKSKALVAGIEARNPGAAFEIALRYAEGRGTEADMAAAAVWFARAAEGGIAPAQFRLGGMYEKGLGVAKDLDQARRYYLAAAERGNAHAMHNLAVLYAEGANGKPEFATAVKWFRKAADHGVTDSQYNAAVLLARGIGIERDLGEAFKWFAVAASGGDKDAAKKRDEIAERLDAQTLAAARLAARIFAPTPQPEEATAVRAPSAGWDDVSVAPPKPRSRARQNGPQSARL